MRKILLIAVLAVASLAAYAQPRAIGGRLGGFNGVSYQHSLGENNMIEIEAGFSVDGRMDCWEKPYGSTNYGRFWGHNVQAAFTYDWIDPFGAKFPWEHKGEWHWYLGAGAAGGYGWEILGYSIVSTMSVGGTFVTNGTSGPYTWNFGYVGGAGRLGVEYDFWFPLQLSLDYRPTIGLGMYEKVFGGNGTNAGLYWEVTSVCLGVRYKF